MKPITTLSLSVATLLVTLSAPVLNYLPQGGIALDTIKAVASSTLLDVQGRLIDGTSKVLELDRGNYLIEVHSFHGTVGQRVAITLESGEFDTLLLLVDKDGSVIDSNDDIAEGNTNSRLTLTLPYSGTYSAVVTSYRPAETGRYRLSVVAQ